MRCNILWFTAVLGLPAPALGIVNVVTTTQSFGDIVRKLGGSQVKVTSIMRGPENPHHIKPRPSFMMKLRRAKLFVHSGLDMEVWAPLLVKGSRRKHLLYGQPGNVDASEGIRLLEVPRRGELSRAQGDIHVFGNPHYMADPLNSIRVARTIMKRLKRIDPGHAELYQENFGAYEKEARETTARLVKKMKPYRGTRVVVYHRAWPYFRKRFGLVKVGEVEPKPGITPGPRHLNATIEKMRETGTKIIIVDTYVSKKNADFVASKVGGRAVVLAEDVHGLPGCDTYLGTIEHNVDAMIAAFREVGIEPHATTEVGEEAGAKR